MYHRGVSSSLLTIGLDVLVKGTSLQPEWRDLLLLLEDPLEDNFMLWVARVPSSSNIADPPSRGSTVELDFLRPYNALSPCVQ
jgi:hypothetical protein